MPDTRRAIAAAQERHPFLTFELDLRRLPPQVWSQLGEARSKCEHLAGVPLQPRTAVELHLLYMVKGVLATTAIEGNTLSEAQVRDVLEHKHTLPQSKQYLAQEVQNVANACREIFRSLCEKNADARITPALIARFNGDVLLGLDVEAEVTPGKFRHHDVTVARYRAPDWRYVEPLVTKLTEWLESPAFRETTLRMELQILRAIVAHLYVAWIHPFGDGNGRTARLIEFHLLIAAGVPSPAAHLLSNHYNETRSEYYRQLDHASRSGGDVVPFITYAVQGFVDGLMEQLKRVRAQQLDVTWESYVFSFFRGRETVAARRQRSVVLALGAQPVPVAHIRSLTREIAASYAKKTDKTVTRDLRALESAKLIIRDSTGIRANIALVEAFLPGRRVEATAKAQE